MDISNHQKMTEIRARVAAATEETWNEVGVNNAMLTAHALSDIPYLLDKVDELEEEVKRLKVAHEQDMIDATQNAVDTLRAVKRAQEAWTQVTKLEVEVEQWKCEFSDKVNTLQNHFDKRAEVREAALREALEATCRYWSEWWNASDKSCTGEEIRIKNRIRAALAIQVADNA